MKTTQVYFHKYLSSEVIRSITSEHEMYDPNNTWAHLHILWVICHLPKVPHTEAGWMSHTTIQYCIDYFRI